MRIKVIAKSDESGVLIGSDFKLVDAETGRELENVRALELRAHYGDVCILRLEVYPSEVEVECTPEIKHITPEPVPHAPGFVDVTSFHDPVIPHIRKTKD